MPLQSVNNVVKLPPLASEKPRGGFQDYNHNLVSEASWGGGADSLPPARSPSREALQHPRRSRTPGYRSNYREEGDERWRMLSENSRALVSVPDNAQLQPLGTSPIAHASRGNVRATASAGSLTSAEQPTAEVASQSVLEEVFGTAAAEIAEAAAGRAVSFEFLQRYHQWLRKWLGGEAAASISMHEVVRGVTPRAPPARGRRGDTSAWCVSSLTLKSRKSLVETLADTSHECMARGDLLSRLQLPPFGVVTHYVCHSWANTLGGLLESLEQFDVLSDQGLPAYFWIDALAMPQHDAHREAAEGGDLLRYMVHIMQKARYMLLCADPWGNTTPLKRLWCIFEMLVWMDLGGAVTLGLTRRGQQTLQAAASDIHDPRGTCQYNLLVQACCRVDLAQARAGVKSMEDRLRDHVRASVGFARLDAVVKGELRRLLDHASAPARLRACHAQLRGAHPLQPGIAFSNLVAILRRDFGNLAAVDLSGCRACSMPYNDLSLLEAALTNNSTVTALNMTGCQAGPALGEAMAGVLMNNPRSALHTLILDGNFLVRRDGAGLEEDVTGMEALAAAMESNNQLTFLSLKGNFIGPEGMNTFAAGLHHNAALTGIDLGGNLLNSEGATELISVIAPDRVGEINSAIHNLNLWKSGLCVDSAWEVTSVIKERAHRPVILCGEHLGMQAGRLAQQVLKPVDAVLLANDLAFNQHITLLDLSDNFVGAEGAMAIADALNPQSGSLFNQSLCSLDLSGNWLYDEGTKALLVPFTPDEQGVYNTTLTSLNIAGARVGARGAEALAALFTPNAGGFFNDALTSLNVSQNDLCAGELDSAGARSVDVSGLRALSLALSNTRNTLLSVLNMWDTHFSEEAARTITHTLTNRRAHQLQMYGEGAHATVRVCGSLLDVVDLDLTDKELDAAAAVLMANDLVMNSTLVTLDLSGNKLGVRGAVSIAAAFAPDAHGFSNHTITCLMLRNNHIGQGEDALDGFAAFGKVLATNKHITHLDLSGNAMSPAGAAALFAGVARSTSLQTLALDDNQVMGRNDATAPEVQEGLRGLVRALHANSRLGALSLMNNHLGPVGVALLVEALRANKTLHTLDVRGNHIVGDCVQLLAAAVVASPSQWVTFNRVPLAHLSPQCKVSKLDLHEEAIGSVGAMVLAIWLIDINCVAEVMVNKGTYIPLMDIKQGSLSSVRHTAAHLGPESLMLLCSVLMLSGHVITLNLAGNSICGVGDHNAGEGLFDSSAMTLLAETLKFNTSIARVILGNNRLQASVEAEEAPAVQVVSDVIRHNTSLTHLDLNNAFIGPSGAKALAQGAMLSTTLKTLEISGNSIGVAGARVVADVLLPPSEAAEGGEGKEFNRSLQSITLTRGADLPIGLLRDNKIENLNLRYKGMGVADAIVLAAGMKLNTSLKALDLTGNRICGVTAKGTGKYEIAGMQALADAVQLNSTLGTLKLGGNVMRIAGARTLANAITPATGLTVVIVHTVELPIGGLRNGSVQHVDLSDKKMFLEEAIVLGAGVVLSKKVETVTMQPGVRIPVRDLLRFTTKALTDLCRMKLGPLEGAVLGRILMSRKNLSTLNLAGNVLGPAGVFELAMALTPVEGVGFSMLRTLDVSANSVCGIARDKEDMESIVGTYNSKGILALADAMVRNNSLQFLTISETLMGTEGMSGICKSLTPNEDNKHSQLTSLVLRGDEIGASLEQLELLTSAIKRNFALKTLDLTGNGINAKGAEILAVGVRMNKALTTIVLAENEIGDAGAADMAAAFIPTKDKGCNRFLITLDLRGNGITLKGAVQLAGAVNSNSALEYVTVNKVPLPVGVLRKNDVVELDLRRKQLAPIDAVVLAAGLRLNSSLRSLNISENQLCGINEHGVGVFEPSGFLELANALDNGPPLNSLDIGNNALCGVYLDFHSRVQGNYQSGVLKKTCESISWFPSLTALSIAGNDITDEGMYILNDAIEKSENMMSTLRILNVEHNGLKLLPPLILKPNSIVALSANLGNILEHIPEEILDKGDDAILAYVKAGQYKPKVAAARTE